MASSAPAVDQNAMRAVNDQVALNWQRKTLWPCANSSVAVVRRRRLQRLPNISTSKALQPVSVLCCHPSRWSLVRMLISNP